MVSNRWLLEFHYSHVQHKQILNRKVTKFWKIWVYNCQYMNTLKKSTTPQVYFVVEKTDQYHIPHVCVHMATTLSSLKNYNSVLMLYLLASEIMYTFISNVEYTCIHNLDILFTWQTNSCIWFVDKKESNDC